MVENNLIISLPNLDLKEQPILRFKIAIVRCSNGVITRLQGNRVERTTRPQLSQEQYKIARLYLTFKSRPERVLTK